MAYLSDYQYYKNSGVAPEDVNRGEYQYVSLIEIVNNFMMNYTGNHSLINNEERFKVIFHAKRAIQELHYDAMKEVKMLELNIDEDLRFILPRDFVNWIRISIYKEGRLYPLSENVQTNYAKAYLQENSGMLTFDINNNIVSKESSIDADRLSGATKSIYLNNSSILDGVEGYGIGEEKYFSLGIGARFGLNTETANVNPTFVIDKKSGVINFSSGVEGESCILEYVSDGMEGGDDSKISVNKLFESYVYAYINYEILKGKFGIQEYIVHRARKEKTALLRNSRIRMSGMNPGKLLMSLRGGQKIIK